jgi:NADH-quinone oxidoreductase subunit E
VSQLRGGEAPKPTRGAPLCTFKQISRQIAGFFDDENAVAADANGTGVPTEVGVKLAIERGDTAPSYAATDAPPQQHDEAEAPQAEKPPAKKAPAKKAAPRKRAPAKKTTTSAHDAPLETSESDKATATEPGDDAPTEDDTKDGLW